jgi:hypothetical protein
MKPDDIAAAQAERLKRWGDFLRQRNATPVMMVGLSWPDKELVITCVEEMTARQIEHILTGAAAMVRRGRADYR